MPVLNQPEERFPDSPISTTQPVEHLVFGKYPLTTLNKLDKAIWTPADIEKIDEFCHLYNIRKKADIPENIAALRIECHEDPALFSPEWNEWMDGKFFSEILAVARNQAQSLQQTEHCHSFSSDLPKFPIETKNTSVSIPIPHCNISETGAHEGIEVSHPLFETDVIGISEILLPSKVESLRTEAMKIKLELRKAASERDKINEQLQYLKKKYLEYDSDLVRRAVEKMRIQDDASNTIVDMERVAQAAWEELKKKLSKASGEGEEYICSLGEIQGERLQGKPTTRILGQPSSSERIVGSFPIEEEDLYSDSDDDGNVPRSVHESRTTTPPSRDPLKEYPGQTLFDEVGRQAVRESAFSASVKDVTNAVLDQLHSSSEDRYKQGLSSSRYALTGLKTVPDKEQTYAAIKLVHDSLFCAAPVTTASVFNNTSDPNINNINDRVERKIVGSQVDTTTLALNNQGNQPCHRKSEFQNIVDDEDPQPRRQLQKQEEFYKIVVHLGKWCDEMEKEMMERQEKEREYCSRNGGYKPNSD